MASSTTPAGRKNRSKNPTPRLLLKALLCISILAVIGCLYWQQKLLRSSHVNETASAFLSHWDVGIPQRNSTQQQQNNVSINTKNEVNPLQLPKTQNKTIKVIPRNDSDMDTAIHHDDSNITTTDVSMSQLPPGFQSLLKRSIKNRDYCNTLPQSPQIHSHTLTVGNETKEIADLPNFGIVNALQNYSSSNNREWQCQVPPPTECNATQFTVIFMGYNPDRVQSLKRQVFSMTQPNSAWSPLVKEAILVWNGERNLSSTDNGRRLLKLASDQSRQFRIFFPLLEGFPNDLMNRYHPRFHVTTKAILFYDDDGPFYSFEAILSGFELWKRNSNAQIGAMARKLDFVGEKKHQAKQQASLEPFNDHAIIPHCRASGDELFYNFFEFANYHARMVLPSGSFLHSYFLCFLWHPALEEVRQFVRHHPVHPDDATVSTIISHVSGRAPKVYSRRINPQNRRRLQQQQQEYDDEPFPRRKLLWQDVSKNDWATMRSMAVNSLVSYFGGVNSGSIGWCHETPFMSQDKNGYYNCKPEMAQVGMLPWMSQNHTPKDTCP